MGQIQSARAFEINIHTLSWIGNKKKTQTPNHGTCHGKGFRRRHYYIAVLYSSLIGLQFPYKSWRTVKMKIKVSLPPCVVICFEHIKIMNHNSWQIVACLWYQFLQWHKKLFISIVLWLNRWWKSGIFGSWESLHCQYFIDDKRIELDSFATKYFSMLMPSIVSRKRNRNPYQYQQSRDTNLQN